MRNKKFYALLLLIVLLALSTVSCKNDKQKEALKAENKGIIFANPEDIASNISLDEIQAISEFFSNAENKVKIQFPIPQSRYAWQQMSKFYPTEQILRDGAVSDLPYAIQNSIGSVSYTNRFGEMLTVDDHFNKFPIDSMIVIEKGVIVYERYKTMRPIDKHIWFSVSKVISTSILLMLEAEGKIDIEQPVTFYLPELKGSVWDSVKVIDALNMATGLNGTEHDEPTGDSRTNPKQIWFRWGVTLGLVPPSNSLNENWVDILKSMERRKPSFTAFEYNSINTFIIDRIVERAGGKTLSRLYGDYIWGKLGMEHDGYMGISNPNGLSMGFAFMNSTLRDLGRFGMIYTPSVSKISKDTILTKSMIEKMQSGKHPEMYLKGFVGQHMQTSFPDEKGLTNSYQWDAVFTDGDMFKAGVGGQGLYVSPSKDTVIAWFSTGTGTNQEETMARAIVKSLK